MPQELAPLARRLQPASSPLSAPSPYSGVHGAWVGCEVFLLAGGVGARRAGAAAEALLDRWEADLLVMAGVAGALAPGLRVGDVVVADAVLTPEGVLRPSFQPAAPSAASTARCGAFLSLDQVLVTPDEKRKAVRWSQIGEASAVSDLGEPPASAPPLVVEMETAGFARAAEGRGVQWGALRAVSDTADEALPLDFNRLRLPDGDLPSPRVALAALRQPRSIPGLIRLGRNTGRAAAALAGYLEAWLRTL